MAKDYETVGGEGETGVLIDGRLVGVVREIAIGDEDTLTVFFDAVSNFGPTRRPETKDQAIQAIVTDARKALGLAEAKR
ncbi:MAG TPA: hypothetical protein VGM37_01250 [Armatimonadota bacterium]|jgi:hypothetical protein